MTIINTEEQMHTRTRTCISTYISCARVCVRVFGSYIIYFIVIVKTLDRAAHRSTICISLAPCGPVDVAVSSLHYSALRSITTPRQPYCSL